MPSKKLPKISIVTPSYNQSEFLEDTIQSVLNQEYPNLEYIIIDGGSTDKSIDIINKYEQYLTYWISEKDRGQAHAINKGFIRTTGDILAWLNSDDFYYPDTLKYIAQAYQKYPEAGLYIGNGYIVDKHRNIIRPFSLDVGFDAATLIDGQNYINQPSVFINRKAFDEAGFLDESLNNEFDVEYWIRIGKGFEAVVMAEFLSAFRWYDEIKTASSGFNRWVEMYKVRQRCTGMGLTPGLLVEFFHIAKNEPLVSEMGKDIKSLIEKAYELTFSFNQKSLNLTNNVPAGRGIYFVPDKKASLTIAEEKISAPLLIHHTGSKPKVDIVLQATGTHSWGVYGGWANAAHKLGILNRVFTPKAQWGEQDVTDDDGLLSYLLNPQADIILLPGFDWHSQMLHTSAKWRDRWINADIHKILFSHEAIERSCVMFENDLMKDAALSASQCIDGIVHIDLNDIDFWKQTEKPFMWQLLGVDDRIFSIQKDFRNRIARPFFRGQFTPHFTSKTYDQRRSFMQFLIEKKAVEVLEYIKGQKPDKVVEDFNNYQIAVNLPTLSAYHPSRVTEALACGCALITNRTDIEKLDNLFIHKEHLLYYSTKEELLEAVRLLSSDREFSLKLAQNGHNYVLEHFTLDKLLLEILSWTNSSDTIKKDKKEGIENFIHITEKERDIRTLQSTEHKKHKKIIIDGVTFFLQKDRPLGISRLWKSLLTELSFTPLADRILLLDRDSTAPFIPGIRWRNIRGYENIHFEDDSLYLEEICHEEEADLFISTYYTYPENSRCALMLYDMIPELTGMDLSLPEWRAKAKAIEKAHAYFSISESTRNDFRKLYPQYSHKEIYITHPAVSTEFRPNSPDEISSFRKEYCIQKPYFMIVGHRGLYKNAHLFFRAFSLLDNKYDYEILCTGGAKELEKNFQSYIKNTRCQVRFLSDRDLSIAYSGAIALVYPSQYEGFGLPILEAMKSGCPVITCRNSSIPEVAGENALYVDIHDVAGMQNALLKVQDPHIRESHINKGIENSKRFTWGNTCTEFVTALNGIIANLKNIPINSTDPMNTKERMFYILAKRPDSADLLSAMKQLEQVRSGSEDFNPLKLLDYEEVVANMNPDIFNLFKQNDTDSGEGDGFLFFCYGLALEQQGSFQEALNAYLMARKQGNLGNVLQWRVTYSAFEIAYQLEKLQLAKELLEDFLLANPNFHDGQKRLKEIEDRLKKTSAKHPSPEIKQKTIDTKAVDIIQQAQKTSGIKVSAIVSAYNSEKFMRGCLEDLVNQTLYEKGELEIIVVDSGSQENEHVIVNEFRQKYNNILYIRTEKRETVYAAWNRGIKSASGKYVTNANTDDRHRKDALEVMAYELDSNPDIALVYCDQIITETENETFDKCTPAGYLNWPDYNRAQLFHCPCVGPQPVWRKSLHDEFGYFDESLKIAGDYDWWLRVSEKYPFRHVPDLLGLYFLSPHGIESANEKLSYLEAGKVRKLYGERAKIICDFDKYRLSYKVDEYPLSSRKRKEQKHKTNPLVSVIVPTFNRPEMLQETLRSIIDQTYKNYEIIVVNDAGVDVENIVAEKKHGRNIIHIKHSSNKGLAGARNTGINAANGKYIAYLDDDDIFYPEHLETLVKFLESSGYKAAYTDAYRAYQAEENGRYIIKKRELTSSPDFDYNRILISNYIPVLCFMHEKSCLDEVGLFDEALTSHEDWDLWIRMSRKFQFGHIRKITAEYRFRTDGSTMFSGRRADMLRTAEMVHAKHSAIENNPLLAEERRLFIETLRKEVFGTHTAPVSIIIPTYNNYDLTLSCIEAIRKTADAVPYEIIVVDNGSADMTPEYLFQEQAAGRIRTVINKENLGFSKANNQGAKVAKGKYLLFLNNDTIPQPHWLEEMFRIAESDKNIGIVGSKLLFPDGTIQHAGVVFYKTRKPYHIYRGLPSDIPCVNKQRDFKIVTGACMLIRKVLFFEINGFDERYINGCEDLDLCLKVGQKNKLIIYNPKSVVIHLEAQTEGRENNMDSNRKLFESTWKDKIQQDDIYYLQQDKMELRIEPDGSFRYSPSEEISDRIKVSIIIVTFNSETTLRACLNSIFSSSRQPFEIIVVDNASKDMTQSILQEYEGRLTTVLNNENKGFSYACNQGIRISEGKHIILLNPDTIVAPKWIERMISHFSSDVGAVGPISNYAAGFQNMELYKKESLPESLAPDAIADKFYFWYEGRALETKLLIGFCLMLRRDILDQIGMLDENLFLGNEDLEISWRLRLNGFKLKVALDTFVFHKGQVSFNSESKTNTSKLITDSGYLLHKKLQNHYGEKNVPSSTELWGLEIFGIMPDGSVRKDFNDINMIDTDLTKFGYKQNIVSNKFKDKKVAVIYDNTVRPDTTGEYCKRALSKICAVTHYLPSHMNEIPEGFDLYLNIDDSFRYILPSHLRPSAWWVIDTHLQYEWDLHKAKTFDHVFTAQKDGARKLSADGVANVSWIPLACDPEIHHEYDLPKKWDICFVGNVFPGPRERMLTVIQAQFSNIFIGNKYFDEMAKTYSESRIVFNQSIRNDVNMRVFEALSCGSLLVTNNLDENGLSELFTDGAHLISFRNEKELIEKLKDYLQDDKEREKIAYAGMEEAQHNHTYGHRMYCILETCFTESPSKNFGEKEQLVSIVILTHNQLEHTIKCLDSIKTHTPEPHEIIIVDNNSTDGTLGYLRDYMKARANLRVISNNSNRGFAGGNNQGISLAHGSYILLLNNDTVVTQGWLSRMLNVLERYPDTDIVGPMSNYVSGQQLVHKIGYKKLSELDSFANRWSEEHKGQSFSIHRVVGFCLLAKREVIDRIGGLDERFGSGNFEDDDFCIRAALAGCKARIAQDVFIHHTGRQTFEGAGIDFSKSLERNWELFKAKWKIPADIPYNMGYPLPSRLPSGESLYLALPSIVSDHKTDDQKRWWEETRKKEQGGKQVEVKVQEQQKIKGLTSIIVLLANQQEHIRLCIKSIQKHTKEPYEIILVPDSAAYSAPKWLRKLIKENSNYKLLINNEPGFARICNKGINASSGEYVALLDASVIAAEEWLSGLLECLNRSSNIGIVGPMSTNVEGPQKITADDNTLFDNLERYAKSFREKNRYRRVRARKLESFCMVFRSRLTEIIGLFDEQFEGFEYADDDYCLRAAMEGFTNFIAGDVFVYCNSHENQLTDGIYSTAHSVKDKRTFSRKWGGLDETSPESKKLFSTNAFFVADEYNQRGQKEKAVLTLLEGIKANPEDRRLHYSVSEILIEEKKFAEALNILEHMPLGIDPYPEETINEHERLELIGYSKEGIGLDEEADRYADDILRLSDTSSKVWILKGALAFKKKLYADAEKFFLKALETDRGLSEAHTNLGALEWINGNKEKALHFFEKAFILSPTIEDVVTNYYTAVVSLSKLPQAEKLFREAIPLHPANRRLQFILIDNLLQQNKFNEAMQSLEEAMATFGIDDDTLSIALNLRAQIGPMKTDKTFQDSVSLCMIVKNEESNIINFFQGVKPLVNEMIVVDTGSTDRTKKIARAFGAKVYDIPWENDFAAARNFSLSKASCSWVLVLDADEIISPVDYKTLKELVRISSNKRFAYSIVTRNYVGPVSVNWHPNDGKYKEEAGSGWFPSEKVRLFPNDSRIRFERPVHEMVEYSLQTIGMEIKSCDIPVHHYGKLNREEIREKGEEYYQLGKKKLEEQGKYSPNAVYELAVQASELEKYDEALDYWKKLIVVKPDFAKAYHGAGTSYFQLGRYEDAVDSFKTAIQLDPDSKDPAVMYSTCELLMGNVEAAISRLEVLLKKDPMYALALLAITTAHLCAGRKEKGLEYIKKVEKTNFSLSHYFRDIAKLLISVRRFDYAISLLEAAIETNNTLNETQQLLAECYGKQKEKAEVEVKVENSKKQGLKDSSEIIKKNS
ncbi:MAG: glycosyltransferase [Nitrospira sp.]|nr:glycosyltransferase [Nitrospira sp.]